MCRFIPISLSDEPVRLGKLISSRTTREIEMCWYVTEEIISGKRDKYTSVQKGSVCVSVMPLVDTNLSNIIIFISTILHAQQRIGVLYCMPKMSQADNDGFIIYRMMVSL